ncbi:hypothetical protein [Lacticaseibacillus paracasei]|uniref:hypothetical protein n=1 Tax=Lacticaseibacillus paracasei TaxID=1597 RepID=UPI003DA8F2EA
MVVCIDHQRDAALGAIADQNGSGSAQIGATISTGFKFEAPVQVPERNRAAA